MNKIEGNFHVNGMDFEDYFNQVIRPSHRSTFPNTIHKANFRKFMSAYNKIVSRHSISTFIGVFSIVYNETGGTFAAIREIGGPAYCFEKRQLSHGWGKQSYNRSPNRKAGDQLKGWGVISNQSLIDAWNGENQYPSTSPKELLNKAQDCDFYKYRGIGYIQITWHNAYKICFEPSLKMRYGKSLDDYTTAELDNVLLKGKYAYDIQAEAMARFLGNSKALIDLNKGNFAPFGFLIAGAYAYDYVRKHYLPRCISLNAILTNKLITEDMPFAIDGLALTPSKIKGMQTTMMLANEEVKAYLEAHGGADGIWGNASEQAFKICNTTIEELIKVSTWI